MNKSILQILFIKIILPVLTISCAFTNPNKMDVHLEETFPVPQRTTYSESLSNLGLMTDIYDVDELNIMSLPIGDNTGTALSTQGEIPHDITEMVKSSLNSIGGKVVYIPYDPAFMINIKNTEYSTFSNKVIPNIVITGGITEFDRGLQTTGKNRDISVGFDIEDLPEWVPGQGINLRAGCSSKAGMARIGLDFNLEDFETRTGIAKMTTENKMEVRKALGECEFGISLFGQVYGEKGSLKRVQGRHAAVRLLVEMSMIHIIGKYNYLPYWRLLGNDAQPDKHVIGGIKNYYYSLSKSEVIRYVQSWLFLYGYDLSINGKLDKATITALQHCKFGYEQTLDGTIDVDTFLAVYLSIPINENSMRRRNLLTLMESGVKVDITDKSSQYYQNNFEQISDISSAYGYCKEPVIKEHIEEEPPQKESILIASNGKDIPSDTKSRNERSLENSNKRISRIGLKSGFVNTSDFGISPWIEVYNKLIYNKSFDWDIAFNYSIMEKDKINLTSYKISNYWLLNMFSSFDDNFKIYAGPSLDISYNYLEAFLTNSAKSSIHSSVNYSSGFTLGTNYKAGNLSLTIDVKYNFLTAMEYKQTNESFKTEEKKYNQDGIGVGLGVSYIF